MFWWLAGPCTWNFSTGLWVDLFFVNLNCCVEFFSVIYCLYLFLFGFLPLFYLCLCFCANQIAPTICHLGKIFKNVHTITDAVFATTKKHASNDISSDFNTEDMFSKYVWHVHNVETLFICFWGFWSCQLWMFLKFLSICDFGCYAHDDNDEREWRRPRKKLVGENRLLCIW